MTEAILSLGEILEKQGIKSDSFPIIEFKRDAWSKTIEKYGGIFSTESDNIYSALGFIFRVVD